VFDLFLCSFLFCLFELILCYCVVVVVVVVVVFGNGAVGPDLK